MLADDQGIVIFFDYETFEHLIFLSVDFALKIKLLLCHKILTIVNMAIGIKYSSSCCPTGVALILFQIVEIVLVHNHRLFQRNTIVIIQNHGVSVLSFWHLIIRNAVRALLLVGNYFILADSIIS